VIDQAADGAQVELVLAAEGMQDLGADLAGLGVSFAVDQLQVDGVGAVLAGRGDFAQVHVQHDVV